jgi:ketosteroid isomerase-like protein
MTTSSVTTDNAATVAGIYAAFGRGDVPTILGALADDVAWDDWADNYAQRAGAPDLVARRGRADVGRFFELLGSWTVLDFAVLDIIGTGRQVAAEVRLSLALPGGGRFADEELHLWTFDEGGRVTRLRHYCDTAKHIAAARGEDTTAR